MYCALSCLFRGDFWPRHCLLSCSLATSLLTAAAQSGDLSGTRAVAQSPWADFVEKDFPFISSVLDARKLGPQWPTNNLTPRGLILNLGNDCWACFDTDLLRMSAIWHGEGITMVGMASGSYRDPGAKVPEGQQKLPQIIGTPWIANGLYPGWQTGEQAVEIDPRQPGQDQREIGRGPLPESLGQFQAIRLTQRGVCLEYSAGGASIREWVESRNAGAERSVQQWFRLENVPQTLWLMLGYKPSNPELPVQTALSVHHAAHKAVVEEVKDPSGLIKYRIAPSTKPVEFAVTVGTVSLMPGKNEPRLSSDVPPDARWPQVVTANARLATAHEAFVLDDIPLPLQNPWRRNVRLADIAFFRDGRAATVTMDGDVWIITGLHEGLAEVRWKRFTSGLHEPLSLCVRDDELFVFDRNGIWRLRDNDRNDEADVHEMFSNAFAQTAETREYANGMKLAPDGSFIIAKGGQQGSTLGQHNGTVMQVSPDGKSAKVIGWGLRQPFIGVHPKTGVVTASDQQGHYVPTTPLHIIRDHQYYGFLAGFQPKEKYPASIADPLTWIPHPVNASGAGQVWLTDARMGTLNDALIHLGYTRPEMFLVRMNGRGTRPQAAVISLTRNLEFAPLNGAVNPRDGQLYVTGFQIWGSIAKKISGLVRMRHTALPSTSPREIAPMDKGILLRFDVALDPKKATDPANYSIERWNYRRTASYGSPHFKLDGSTGQEWMTASSAYLSKDGKNVFVGIPDMRSVMQMRIGWALVMRGGTGFEQNAYLTVHELTRFEPTTEGFEALAVDLTPRVSQVAVATEVSVHEGKRLAELMGCLACHSTDGVTVGKVGPTWKGLFGSERVLKGGKKVIADEAYFRESILDPTVKVVKEYEKSDTGMPSYAGVLSDAQIEALLLYIKASK